MFGKKNRQEINAHNRDKIIGQLDTIRGNCKNMALGSRLSAVYDAINNHSASPSPKMISYDAPILRYLQALHNDIIAKSYRVAAIRLEIIETIVGERSAAEGSSGNPYASGKELRIIARSEKELDKWYKDNMNKVISTFSIDELYKPEEIYRINIAGRQDLIDSETAKLEKLKAQLEQNPFDNSVISDMQITEEQINGLKEQISVFMNERMRDVYLQSLGNATATQKQLIVERSYSDEQAQIVMQEYKDFKKKVGQDPVLQFMLENRGGTTGAANMGAVNQTSASSVNSIGMGGPQVMPGVSDNIAKLQQDAIERKNKQKELDDLKNSVRLLERNEERFQMALEVKDLEMREVDAQLAKLLGIRKTLTASQRLTTDGTIDSLNAKRNRIVNSINQINQARSINTEKLSLVSNKVGLMDVLSTGVVTDAVADYDFEQMAIELKEAAERGNAELDRLGTAYLVSTSTEFRSGAMSGTNQVHSESLNGLDDDKYAELEKLLGIPTDGAD